MQRYFSLLEIVGFESFIKNNSEQEVIRLYWNLVSEIRKGLAEYKGGQDRKRDFNVQLYPLGKHIALIEDNDSSAAFFYVVWATQMAIPLALSEGFPVVGCVHCGSFPHQEKFGIGANDALNFLHLGVGYWEALSAIDVAPAMGCLITGAAQNLFQENRTKQTYTLDDLVRLNLLANIPIENISEPAIAVNWMADRKLTFTRGFLAALFAKHNKEVDERTEYLISNTVAFIASIQSERLN